MTKNYYGKGLKKFIISKEDLNDPIAQKINDSNERSLDKDIKKIIKNNINSNIKNKISKIKKKPINTAVLL